MGPFFVSNYVKTMKQSITARRVGNFLLYLNVYCLVPKQLVHSTECIPGCSARIITAFFKSLCNLLMLVRSGNIRTMEKKIAAVHTRISNHEYGDHW